TAGTVLAVNASTNAIACAITVGNGPTNLAISPDSTTLYVENDTDGTVSVISLASGTVTSTLTITGSAMTANLAVDPDNSRVYVVTLPQPLAADTQASLYVITVPALAVSSPISVVNSTSPTPVTGPGLGISFTPDATKAYVTTEGLTYIIST